MKGMVGFELLPTRYTLVCYKSKARNKGAESTQRIKRDNFIVLSFSIAIRHLRCSFSAAIAKIAQCRMLCSTKNAMNN